MYGAVSEEIRLTLCDSGGQNQNQLVEPSWRQVGIQRGEALSDSRSQSAPRDPSQIQQQSQEGPEPGVVTEGGPLRARAVYRTWVRFPTAHFPGAQASELIFLGFIVLRVRRR